MIQIPSQAQTCSEAVAVNEAKIIVTFTAEAERIGRLEEFEVCNDMMITKFRNHTYDNSLIQYINKITIHLKYHKIDHLHGIGGSMSWTVHHEWTDQPHGRRACRTTEFPVK